MLKRELIHPQILRALGSSGHGSKVLIADGNYPFRTHSNPDSEKVFLNLSPGIVKVPSVLSVLKDSLAIEGAEVMEPGEGQEPPIFSEFREIIPKLSLVTRGRFKFYQAAKEDDVSLVIATGEQRTYANILLTIGVVDQ